jgi:hypothetical protein
MDEKTYLRLILTLPGLTDAERVKLAHQLTKKLGDLG